MTTEQIVLFVLLFFVFVFLIWGRWRYDLIAFCALLIAVSSMFGASLGARIGRRIRPFWLRVVIVVVGLAGLVHMVGRLVAGE